MAVRSKETPLSVDDCYLVGQLILENLDWTDTRGRQEWSLRRPQSEVLKAATIDGAKIIGFAQDLGSIEAGKLSK